MTPEEIHMDLVQRYSARNYNPMPVVLSYGEGVWISDIQGTRYLDCLSAYSALNHGHRHPKIIAAAKEQLDNLTLTSRAFQHDQFGAFCQELAEFCQMEAVLPMNTGAEAVETAIKMARRWGYSKKKVADNQAEIIVCNDNFHGRTTTIVGFSTEAAYKEGFGPFAPGFKNIPYGDIKALEKAITPNTVAFLVEPIQGEAGIILPPPGFLKQAFELCKKQNVLFVADEIQSGLGRAGKRLACHHEGVQSDVVILGKALGGGVMPVSAVLSRWDIMEVFDPGSHGSTFGGNPLACAVARAALQVLEEENLVEHSFELGEYALATLNNIDSELIKEVRGKGLLIGIELKPEAGGARQYCMQLMEKGILCWETHEHVIRLAPPLIIQKSELDQALDAIQSVLTNPRSGFN